MCLSFIIFQSILKRWGYSWDRISWKGRLVVGLISLGMFVVPIKIIHIKWMQMKEEQLLEDRLRKAMSENEKVKYKIPYLCRIFIIVLGPLLMLQIY